MKKFLIVVLLVGLASEAEATTRTVAPSCSGQPSPCYTTVQAAVDASVAGDIVNVNNGTYNGAIVFSNGGSAGNPITVRSTNDKGATIQGVLKTGPTSCFDSDVVNQSMFDTNDKSNIVIGGSGHGFIISGGNSGVLAYPNSQNISVLYNEVKLSCNTGIAMVGGSGHIVQGNIVHDTNRMNWPRGACLPENGCFWGAGVTAGYGAAGSQILDNVVYWNGGEGISCHTASHNCIIRGNISSDNWSVNIYADDADNITIDRNLSYVTNDAINWSGCVGRCSALRPDGIAGSTEETIGNQRLSGLRVSNNIVVNAGTCFDYFHSINSTPFDNAVIANNTCVGTGEALKFNNASDSIANLIVRNNIVARNNTSYAAQMRTVPSSKTISNNIYSGTANSFYWMGDTNFTGWSASAGEASSSFQDPLLASPTVVPPRLWDDIGGLGAGSPVSSINVNNYALTSSSPARNNGANLSATFTTDYNGTTRNTWDIGALAFAGGVAPPVVVINRPTSPNCVGTNTACTITGSANNILQLAGSVDDQSATVTWACVDVPTSRCGNGTVNQSAGLWQSTQITLKSGINIITVSAANAGGTGSATITVTFVPTFPGNTAVGLWAFEDGSGTSATDSSGNGNTGTLTNGPTWVTNGRFGKAIQFDGTNDYLSISGTLNNSLNLTQSWTISAWVQPSTAHTDMRAIVHKNAAPVASPYELYGQISAFASCGNGGFAALTDTNGSSGPRYVVCDGDNVAPHGPPLQTGVWTHLAATYDGASLKLYRDGALVVNTPATGYIEPSTLTLQIGATEFGENWQGLIDEVRIYNFALPVSAASNTVPGAQCTATNWLQNTDVNTASIIGNMNCPIINLSPPAQFKVSSGATAIKIFSNSSAIKIGANP